MIKDSRQYANTKKKLAMLIEDLKTTRKKYSDDKNKLALLSQGYLDHIEQLKSEIEEYEMVKNNPLPKVLSARHPNEIYKLITKLRIKRKVTQSQLASRIGCKQSDISRLERKNYRGYSIETLEKIANELKADMELRLIPKSK